MGAESLPSPPLEEAAILHHKMDAKRPKQPKSTHRVSKRGNNTTMAHSHHHSPPPSSPHSPADGARHKRVWKACERCRMKKTKCDGEFPCKRCKDDGLICQAGSRRKMDFKTLPRGYAEVLENSQFALVSTVHKLYAMVRKSQAWNLDEPDLNDRGQPVVHSIAERLGCIRPNNDIDIPTQSAFPETQEDIQRLTSLLEEQQRLEDQTSPQQAPSDSSFDRSSPGEHDHSEGEELHTPASVVDGFSRGSLTQSSPEMEYALPMYNHLPSEEAAINMVPNAFFACNDFDPTPWGAPSPTFETGFLNSYPNHGGLYQAAVLAQMGYENPSGMPVPNHELAKLQYMMGSPGVMVGHGDPTISPSYDQDGKMDRY